MTLRLPRIPIFVSLLDALPIRIANGLSILESDVAEGITIEIFGQRLTLPTKIGAADDERVIVFEGQMARPLVQIANVCTLALPRIRISIHSSVSSPVIDSVAVDVQGEACLELHFPSIFGANPILLDGKLQIVTQKGLALQHLRIDFEQASWSFPLPSDAALWVNAKYLDISLADETSPRIEMQVECSVEGISPRIQQALGKTGFDALVRWTKEGTTISTMNVCERLKVPLPSFPAFGEYPAWNLGEIVLSAKFLRINVGDTIECSLDIGLDIPQVLHEFLEPHLDLRISFVNEDVRLELLSAPFKKLDCLRVPNGNLRARIRVGEGKVSFDLPSLRIDWTRRCIIAEGHIAHQNLRIPMAPLQKLLDEAGLHVLVKHIPNSIAIQSYGLSGLIGAFSDLLTDVLKTGFWADRAREVLGKTFELLNQLPPRLQENFLRVHVPKEVAFRVECSFDFDASVRFTPAPEPIRSETSPQRSEPAPIRWFVPSLGPHGPELIGITLHHWAFGELHAGQVFSLEIDAEIEIFDLVPRKGFGISTDPSSHIVLRDVLVLYGEKGGIPWLLPVNFRKIAWHYEGFDGMRSSFQCELSLPKLDWRTMILGLVTGAHGKDPNDWLKAGTFECRLGPAYVRLPDSLGGKEFGSKDDVIMLRTPKEIQNLLRLWQKLDMDGLLTMLTKAFGKGEIDVDLVLALLRRAAGMRRDFLLKP